MFSFSNCFSHLLKIEFLFPLATKMPNVYAFLWAKV